MKNNKPNQEEVLIVLDVRGVVKLFRQLALTLLILCYSLFPNIAVAAISFVGSAENSSTPNADTTVDLSGIGLQEGDLVIVTAGIGDDDNVDHNVLNNTADYNEINDLFSNDTDDTNMAVFWKIMGASPDTSVVIEGSTGGTDSSLAVVVMAFRGVDQSTPFDVTSTTATGINTADPNPPSINHNNPSGVWIVIAGASGHVLGGAATYTFPTGYTTDAIDRGHNDTNDITVGMGYRSSGVSDPEDPGTMNHSGTDSTTNSWAAITMALRPAIVNDPPTLNIDQPDGTGDTVTVGDSYNIQYDLADTEDVVTVAFFYDADASGLDGTAISGACATAAEGTDTTCSWDTTGVTPGTYYIYGVTNDGSNPDVTDYSLGQITIEAVDTAPTVTNSSGESGVTNTSATMNGNITATGGADATVRGFAWGTNSTLSNGDTSTTTESGTFSTGIFSQSVINLRSNTTYYYRAYATNSVGTGYSSSIESFVTSVSTTPARKMRLFESYRLKINGSGRMIINQR